MVRVLVLVSFCTSAGTFAQQNPVAAEPPALSFQEALARARQNGVELQSATIATLLAREDRIQAKAALLPSVQYFNQFIYTQPNGTPSGSFVSNDGPHVYNSQAQVHEDLSLAHRAAYRQAQAAEALANAKRDLAGRGLVATLVQDFYSFVAAERHLVNARRSLADAAAFLDITQKQERGGEAAHADVVKAQLLVQQRERDISDAELAIEKARLALAVLIFPDFQQNFRVVDDLDSIATLPSMAEVRQLAAAYSPELRVAQASLRQEDAGVSVARAAYLPSFSWDYFFGLNSNQVAIYNQEHLNNLGSVAQATLNIPVWTWGATESKVRQARLRVQQAQIEVSLAQRELLANLNSFHAEAETASSQIASLQSSAALAAESLRLTLLRYQAGEATALEVADAQTTLAQARLAQDDGLARYRVALGNLQALMGTL